MASSLASASDGNVSVAAWRLLFVIGSPAQFRNRFRSLSNVNRSGSQNASKNAAAAAEKTEYSNGVLMPRPVTMTVANDKRRRPERTEAIRLGVRIPTVKARLFRGRQKASALFKRYVHSAQRGDS